MTRVATNDREGQAILEAFEERRRLLELDDLDRVLKTEHGRRVLHRLVFDLGGLDRVSMNPAIKDGMAMALLQARTDGRRDLAAEVRGECAVNHPDLWGLAIEEHHARVVAETLERERQLSAGGNDD